MRWLGNGRTPVRLHDACATRALLQKGATVVAGRHKTLRNSKGRVTSVAAGHRLSNPMTTSKAPVPLPEFQSSVLN